jgi:hypothetical protein
MYLSKEEMNENVNKNRAVQLSSKETHTSFEHGMVGLLLTLLFVVLKSSYARRKQATGY